MANTEMTVAELIEKINRERRENPPRMPSAEAMIEKAKRALRRRQKNGPALLLEAVNYRIREVDPESDPWVVVKRLAKVHNHSGVESAYWGVVELKEESDRYGRYDKEDAEFRYELGEIVLSLLDEYSD